MILQIIKNKVLKQSKQKKLLVGLGNITTKYQNTRHNVGFMLINYLKEQLNFPDFEEKPNLFCFLTKKTDPNQLTILAKPTTYMNDSGKAIKKIMKYFKIQISDIIIVHDDLDIEFGHYKIQKQKGPRVHNGITSVENQLGTNDFVRIRIGIETRNNQERIKFQGKDFVLSDFKNQEKEQLNKQIFPKIYSDLENSSTI